MTFNPWPVRLRRTMLLHARYFIASRLAGRPLGLARSGDVCVDWEGVAK